MLEFLGDAVVWGESHALAAQFLYVLFVVIATVFFMPGSIAMMVAGFVFGFAPGVLLAAVAIPLAAQSAFEIGRWLLRTFIAERIAAQPRLQAIENALQQQSFMIVILTRISLVVPFNVLNYFFGATSVKSGTHLAATAVGMLPAIVLYVYLGSVAQDLQQVMSGDAAPSQLGVWLAAIGFVVIAVLTWIIHRAGTRALQNYMPGQ